MGGGSTGTRSTPEQRERWKRKSRIKANRKALAAGKPLPWPAEGLGGPRRPSDPTPSGTGAPPPPPDPSHFGSDPGVPGQPEGPVPWDADTVRPLFKELIPAAERAAVESLKAKAAKVDPSLVAEVAKDAGWSSTSKAILEASAPQVAAKWLNRTGVGAENAPEVALAIALGGIVSSHLILASRLERMAAERRPEPPKPADTPKE